ncbi:MAG: DUF2062 domain-containing protein [Flavipsychrobacter sp.]|nr:DUF2062 domain-containing protein [Flavipsychrobacter sp.]
MKSRSIAFGIFMGILPVWGFQLIIGMPLAMLFRLNKTLFFIFMHVSMLPFTPLFWMASLLTGNLLMNRPMIIHDWRHITLGDVRTEGISFILGGTVLAIVAGIATYFISTGVLFYRRKMKYDQIKMKRAMS